MNYCGTYKDMLCELLNAGLRDIKYLVDEAKEVELDLVDVIREVKSNIPNFDINNLINYVYSRKIEVIKNRIRETLSDLKIDFDNEKLSNYTVNIYADYISTIADDYYDIWNSVYEFIPRDIAEFLVKENIVDMEHDELVAKLKEGEENE